MSTSELVAQAVSRAPGKPAQGSVGAIARLVRSELSLVFRRRRNQALLAVLSSAPILLGVAVRLASADGDGANGGGPPFLGQITQNGVFLVFTGLVVALPLFLPLAVAVVSGESVAGEANTGTLRYLLVVPVHRTRLLAVKYTSIVVFAVVAALTVAVVGLVVGLLLFPRGPVTLLSGTTVPYADGLGRALLVALYVAAMLAAVGAIGLFISTLTEVPVGATAATAVLTIVVQIINAIPQVSVIHPYLFTHWWLAFGDLLRTPMALGDVGRGLATQAVYIAVFFALATARFSNRDVTS
jgi:ABC-2 type transport system permease protein